MAKQKSSGWLDKYDDGGPVQPNYNDASTSFPPNFVGAGYNTTGRNYSPAWGGQFQEGGSLKDNAERALALGSIATPFPLNYGLSLAGSAIDLYDAYNAKTPHDRNVQLTEAALGAIPYGRIVKGMKLGTDAYKAYKALKPIAAINSIIDVKDTVDPNLKYAMGGSMPGAVGFMYARTGAPSKGPRRNQTTVTDASAQDGIGLPFISDPKLRNTLEGNKPGLLQPGDYRLPEGRMAGSIYPSSEVSRSVGGEDGEPAYLIPSFKYGAPLQDYVGEYNRTGQHLGGPFKTWQEADAFGKLRHQYIDKEYKTLPSPIKTWGDGFQNGGEMKYYQEGLDFKPKSISKNGSVIKDDRGQWDHPGEITEIGSNQITMQGVPYPVLGISDTGDTQMMYPNEDYTYEGSSVTEYPMMADGGIVDSIINVGKGAVNYVDDLIRTGINKLSSIDDPAPVPVVATPKKVKVAPKLDTYDTLVNLGTNNSKWKSLYEKLDTETNYEEDKNKIKLNTGRFTGANVSSKLIDDIAEAAKRNKIPIGQLLTLAGRESTFGEEKGNSRHGMNKDSYTSGWNVSEDYQPYDPHRFLADKKVPGINVIKNAHGYGYEVTDEQAVRQHLIKNPQLLEQYKKKLATTPDIGNKNYFDLSAEFLKKKGIKGYNPGDPRYVQMFQKDYDTLKQDKALMAYLKKKGYKYEDGGELTKLDQLTNFTNYNTKQPGGWLDKYQD